MPLLINYREGPHKTKESALMQKIIERYNATSEFKHERPAIGAVINKAESGYTVTFIAASEEQRDFLKDPLSLGGFEDYLKIPEIERVHKNFVVGAIKAVISVVSDARSDGVGILTLNIEEVRMDSLTKTIMNIRVKHKGCQDICQDHEHDKSLAFSVSQYYKIFLARKYCDWEGDDNITSVLDFFEEALNSGDKSIMDTYIALRFDLQINTDMSFENKRTA